MRHKWGETDCLLGTCVSECSVCGGWRYRKDDRSGTGVIVNAKNRIIARYHGAPVTRKGWRYDQDTPRSCPGKRMEEQV